MTTEGVDLKRRRFLTAATSVVGGAGVVIGAIPFISSFQPSERARAVGGPVEVDIGKLEPGQRITEVWRGQPIWIMRRDEATISALENMGAELSDPESAVVEQQPEYARNPHRSLKPEYLVVVALCTHLGCIPNYVSAESMEFGPDWGGGFFCPCHGSKFDLAGRVYKNVPAPVNLRVPPYRFLSDTRLLIGADEGAS